jgi:Family of unknown function (DUF5989)
MNDDPESSKAPTAGAEFARHAEESNPGLLSELWDLIITNKKWWLIPTVVVLLVIGVLVFLGSTAAAPFIYTLF